jgi:4-amino-4-deoxy-L-arabinose transferase-like glycosyltransferase
MSKLGMRQRLTWPLLTTIGIAWAFAVVIAYYVVHKPFGVGNALALLRSLLDLLAWLLFLGAATGIGRRVLGRWLAGFTPLEDLVLSTGLGLGIISLLMLAVGLAGGFERWIAWVLVLAIAAGGMSPLRGLWRRLRASPVLRAETRFERLLAIFVLLVFVPALLSALAPPIAWDSQVYHLTGPKLYIAQGRITGGIDIPYLGFPALMETLFATGMLLRGPAVAALIHLSYGILSLLLVYAIADRYLTRRAGWLGIAALAAAPTIVRIASWAYVDLAILFYELASFFLLLQWQKAEEGKRSLGLMALVGVFCGFAIGVKYTAVLLPITLATIMLFLGRKEGGRSLARRTLLFGGATALVAVPWFLRNWAFTGNPIYPFFLPGRFWNEFRAWFYARAGTGLAFEAPWRLLVAPWEATVLGLEGAEGYSATIGPLFLVAVPLLGLTFRRWTTEQRKVVILALAVCTPQYLFWLYGVAQSALLVQTRLLFPIFGFAALLAGFGLDRLEVLSRPAFSLDRLLSALVVLVLGLDLLGAGLEFAHHNPVSYLVGWESANDYLSQYQYEYQQATNYINEELPQSAKVYFLWEPRSFYVDRDVQPDAILDGFLDLRYRYNDAKGIDRYLREQGFTHVLLYQRGMDAIVKAGFDPVTQDDLDVLQALRTSYWSVAREWGNAYVLYEFVR